MGGDFGVRGQSAAWPVAGAIVRGSVTVRRPPPEGLPDDPFSGERFIRVVGRRVRPPIGEPPSAAARAAGRDLLRRGIGAPKGVFRYASHEAANRDWEEWTARAMAERIP
jgi:hypothetical protein